MSILAALERKLSTWPEDLRESPEAALALALAALMDGSGSDTSKSMNAGQLRAVLGDLRAMAPLEQEVDEIDELANRRKQRLADRRSATAD